MIQSWQEAHNRSWEIVRDYLSSTLRILPGRASESLTTVMPALHEWCEQTLADIPDVRDNDDHCVIIWCNLPTQGILTTHKREWVITFLANALNKYKKNGIAVLIHGNRAAQAAPERGFVQTQIQFNLSLHRLSDFLTRLLSCPGRRDGEKEFKEEDEEKFKDEKKEEPSDDDDSENDEKAAADDVDVRDVRYQMEILGLAATIKKLF